MFVFDYLYYRTYYLYKYIWKDSIPGITAVGIVTIAQMSNISFLYFAGSRIFQYESKEVYGIILTIILIVINSIYYRKRDFDYLKDRWDKDKSNQRYTKGVLIGFYLLASIFLFFFGAIKF